MSGQCSTDEHYSRMHSYDHYMVEHSHSHCFFWGAIIVLGIVALVLYIFAELSILKAKIGPLELAIWTFIVLSFPILGSLTWLLGARKAPQYQGGFPPHENLI